VAVPPNETDSANGWLVRLDLGVELRAHALGWMAMAPPAEVIIADAVVTAADGSILPAWASQDPELLSRRFVPPPLMGVRPLTARRLGWDTRAGRRGDVETLLKADPARVRHLERPLITLTTDPAGDPDPAVATGVAGASETDPAPARPARQAVAPAPKVAPHRISVIIPTRNRVDLLAGCIDRIRSTAGDHELEIIVVDNDSDDRKTIDYLAHHEGPVLSYPHPFNFARQIDLGAARATGDLLLLCNNDVTPLSDDWLDQLVGHAVRPEVGAVGARLLVPEGTPTHEGVLVGSLGLARNLALSHTSSPLAAIGETTRSVAAVTAAVTLVRRSVYWATGGLDGRQRVGFNDVDWCLRVGELGWRVIFCAEAVLEHAESASRGSLNPSQDEIAFRQRWGHEGLGFADPFHPAGVINPWPAYYRL